MAAVKTDRFWPIARQGCFVAPDTPHGSAIRRDRRRDCFTADRTGAANRRPRPFAAHQLIMKQATRRQIPCRAGAWRKNTLSFDLPSFFKLLSCAGGQAGCAGTGGSVSIDSRRRLECPKVAVEVVQSDKGYGSIRPSSGGKDIFVYISGSKAACQTLNEGRSTRRDPQIAARHQLKTSRSSATARDQAAHSRRHSGVGPKQQPRQRDVRRGARCLRAASVRLRCSIFAAASVRCQRSVCLFAPSGRLIAGDASISQFIFVTHLATVMTSGGCDNRAADPPPIPPWSRAPAPARRCCGGVWPNEKPR